MVSKDISNKTPNRIPESKIVGPSRFRKPLDDLVSVEGRAFVSPYSSSLIVGSNDADPQKIEESNDKAKVELYSADVPQLSDIESVTPTKYFDPVTKVEKVKVVIKIRNSSKNKNNIAGVDARIPPKEAWW